MAMPTTTSLSFVVSSDCNTLILMMSRTLLLYFFWQALRGLGCCVILTRFYIVVNLSLLMNSSTVYFSLLANSCMTFSLLCLGLLTHEFIRLRMLWLLNAHLVLSLVISYLLVFLVA